MKTNNELKRDVQLELVKVAHFNENEIDVSASDGTIMLAGLQTSYSRIRLAESTAKNVPGVMWVINNIYIKTSTIDANQKKEIEQELKSNLDVEDKDVVVEVEGNKVILSGSVNSQQESNDAAQIARATPGVFNVTNYIKVI